MNKEKKLGIAISVIVLAVCIATVSYAVFAFDKIGDKENVVTTGTLILTLDESASNGISLLEAIPVTDSEGLAFTAYTFTVKNTGTLNANYQLSLVDDDEAYIEDGCLDNKLPHSNIKYSFTKNNGLATTTLLSSNKGLIDTTTIKAGTTNTYTLRVWIDYSATNEIMGQHFHGILELKAIQEGHTNYNTGE